MLVSVRSVVFGVTLAALVFTAPSHAAAQQTAPPTPPEQSSQHPNSDYGSGGHAVMQNDTAGAELKGAVYDPSGTLRHEETNTYTTTGGAERKIEQHAYDFDSKGHLQLGLDYKYDLRGGLNYTDVTHFGLHGERVAEEVTNYRTDGYEIKDWSLGTHQWYTNTIPNKTPLPTGTPAQAPLTPTSTDIGVIIPRSYLPGETITGSLWPSKYAENFKSVPGLSEYSFPVELYHLPDGSPEWSSLEIGVKGDGYVPINPNGTFSLHIPLNWKGSLELQARQPDPVAGIGPTDAQLKFDPPVAAPTVTSDQFPSSAKERLGFYSQDHLLDLWQDAADDEELLDELYDSPLPDWDRICAIEDRLDDTYDDIDEIEDDMPTQEVISLAQSKYRDAINFQSRLGGQLTLSADDKDDLADSKSWSDFLKHEIEYNKYLSEWELVDPLMQPFMTSPSLMQGKLGVIRGSYPIDPYDTYIHIDKFPITPLAATPYNWYFMPPAGLTAGQHDYIIDSPLYSETIFPVFLMTLYMSADNLNLLKGQSTMYHVVLSGLNGLPGGAWSGSSDPTDLVPSSQLSAAQKAVGTSRTGYITLSITNGSPGVIAMQNQFLSYDAASFVPNGSHQTDGEVTALVRGNFTINGEAIAHLDPEIGLGIPPGTTLPTGLTIPPAGSPGGNWFPSFSVNYDPAAFSNSSFMTNSCPGSSATPSTTSSTPTGSASPSTPCVESVVKDLMPLKSTTQNNDVKGNTPDQDEAHKHLEELKEKEKAASLARLGSESQVEQLFTTGLSNAPATLRINLKDAEEKLKNATTEREKASAAELENSTEETQNKFTDAMNNESMAQAEYDSAKQKVIDSFDEDARKEYDAALKVFNEAYEDWRNAFNEMHEAEEDLQKQQKRPVDEVM